MVYPNKTLALSVNAILYYWLSRQCYVCKQLLQYEWVKDVMRQANQASQATDNNVLLISWTHIAGSAQIVKCRRSMIYNVWK